MALNRFLGWSLVELEEEIESTQDQLDRIVQRVSAGDTDVTYVVQQRGFESRLEKLYAAARLQNPEAYPIDQTVRVDRTRAVFPSILSNR